MANLKDIATVIQSGLEKIGVTGTLQVRMDDRNVHVVLGNKDGDDMHVIVELKSST